MAGRRVCNLPSEPKMCDASFHLQEEIDHSALNESTTLSNSNQSQSNAPLVRASKSCETLNQSAHSPDLSSHFMCCYCDFTAKTNGELETHIPLHMIKCFLCIFVSFSKSQLTSHVRREHNDHLFPHTSADEDKDPCTLCKYCDFMTYSSELLEKHVVHKHKETTFQCDQQIYIPRTVSALVRQSDSLFYSSLLLDMNDLDASRSCESNEDEFKPPSPFHEINPVKREEVRELLSSVKSEPPSYVQFDLNHSSPPTQNGPMDENSGLTVQKNIPLDLSFLNSQKKTLYCLSCQYKDVAMKKLKRHMLTQHPMRATVVGNCLGATTGGLQGVTFFCVKEACPHSTSECHVYEEHLMTCCSLQQLSENEKQRLKTSLKCVRDFHQKHSVEATSGFLDFVSSVNKPCVTSSKQDLCIIQNDDDQEYDEPMEKQDDGKFQKKSNMQDCSDQECHEGQADDSEFFKKENDLSEDALTCCQCNLTFSSKDDLEDHMQQSHFRKESLEVVQRDHAQVIVLKSQPGDISKDGTATMVMEFLEDSVNLEQKVSHIKSHRFKYNNSTLQSNCKAPLAKLKCFKCPSCNKSFSRKCRLNVHKKLHTVGERSFTCKDCGKKYIHERDLREHMATHREQKPFKCKACGESFERKYYLVKHRRSHQGKNLLPCLFCGREFMYRSMLDMHLISHTGERPFKCEDCGKSFKRKSHLVEHRETHQRSNLLPCPHCGKKFKYKASLGIHMMSHTGKKPHECTECDKSYMKKCHLMIHLRTHSGEKPFTCELCGAGFIQKKSLQRHLINHTGEKPFKCEKCGKGFTEKGDLRKHYRVHTGEKRYSCEVCGKCFAQSGSKKVHMRIHTGDKPYLCTQCGKSFSSRATFRGHMHTHSKIRTRSFQCSICFKRFYENSVLKSHMTTHTEERPYQCTLCGKCFRKNSQLTYHAKTHKKEVKTEPLVEEEGSSCSVFP